MLLRLAPWKLVWSDLYVACTSGGSAHLVHPAAGDLENGYRVR